ncbi:MAG: CbiX/SirB N-terminal domain-containing protein [Acidobacteria bacterium]|nr:CbiX/SirB N-terminal domain-containing protein [Acidobacteriota bacterium]
MKAAIVKTGIIVFAHGSSIESANEAVRAVTAQLARAGGFEHLDTAFLESAHPDLFNAVQEMAGQGVERIIVVPYFLTLGIHLQRDLPRIVGDLSARYNGLIIDVTEPLDGHPALGKIVLERAQEALECLLTRSPTA